MDDYGRGKILNKVSKGTTARELKEFMDKKAIEFPGIEEEVNYFSIITLCIVQSQTRLLAIRK